ncbi:C10 family peptidase [candidate division KSB1 bacterium]|nr:C10 family peptidase [candidate division KSB1 bacterium]
MNKSCSVWRTIGVICCLLLILFLSTTLLAQAPIHYGDQNRAVLEKLQNIPSRLQHAVTEQQAGLVAKVWLHLCPDLGENDYSIDSILPIYDTPASRVLGFVAHLKPRGFVIIAADNEIRPVVAFSEINNFSLDESPDNIALAMLRVGLSLKLAALEADVVMTFERTRARQLWQDFFARIDINGTIVQDGNSTTADGWDVEAGPFVTSRWSQSTAWGNAVWNYYTPPYGAGNANNYVCGCVATAMAQLINYYEWPITGTGSHTYTWSDGSYTQDLSADYGATTYDWTNTLDNYYTSTTLAQRQAAGLLTFHCGVAVEMQYGAGGSGAYTSDVASALSDYFRTCGRWKDNDGSTFYDQLYATIINQRPGELSIRDNTAGAGHAIVVDGVRHNIGETKYYHLNFGWGGTADGWYDIANSFAAGGYNWDEVTGVVMDVIPSPDLIDPGTTIASTSYNVTWQVASLQNADKYELQHSFYPSTLATFFDGAEDGFDNWTASMTGFWSQSSYRKKTGDYAFQGKILKDGVWQTTSKMTLDSNVKLDATSTITYSWGTYYAYTPYLYVEISSDGASWSQLRAHQDTNNSLTWYDETISSAELSAYAGKAIQIRFTMQGNSTYGFAEAGFYVDDLTINNCMIPDGWTTVNENILSESCQVTVAGDGDYAYRVRAYADGDWRCWSDIEDVTVLQPPTTQATDITCTEPGEGQLCLNWARGNGDGNIVFMRPGSTGQAAPVDNVYYAADAEFGQGDQIGSSGWYCVYNGSGTTVTVSGLASSSEYRIHVCEYNLGSIIYNSNSSSGNPVTAQGPIAVELISFIACYADGQILVEWTTVSEIDIAGFNILVSDKQDGSYGKLNKTLVKSKGYATSGFTYRFIDNTELKTKRWYKLETVNLDGSCDISDPVAVSNSSDVGQEFRPKQFALFQNYPNPFNPETTIRYDLPAALDVTLVIYDLSGHVVRTLVHGERPAGAHSLLWDGRNDAGLAASSGLYLYRIQAGEFRQVRKMTFLK